MKPPPIKISRVKYFPIQENWRKLGPLFRSPEAKSVWLPNMIEYMQQRAHDNKFEYKRRPEWENLPANFDSCDWRWNCEDRGRGRKPGFWDYACHSACHWVADLCLYVAMTAYPHTPWRVVTSHKHSTVWNGCDKKPLLFDVNFSAIGVDVKEAWQLASRGRMLKPGQWLRPWCVPRRLHGYA